MCTSSADRAEKYKSRERPVQIIDKGIQSSERDKRDSSRICKTGYSISVSGCLSDPSSANAVRMKCQLSFVILFEKGHKRANVTDYVFTSCYRASNTVMVARVHRFVHAFDIGFVGREALDKLLGRLVEYDASVDCSLPFNVTAKNSSTAEQSFHIDVGRLRKGY